MNIKIKALHQSYKNNVIHSIFRITNIPKGYGNTIGNAIRRIALISSPGTAISSYKLSCFSHAFDKSNYLVESSSEAMNNFKDVIFKYKEGAAGSITLNITKAGPVYASALTTKDVQVLNEKLVIFNVTQQTSLTLTVTYNSSVGFALFTQQKVSANDEIPVTALYSRILNANFKLLTDTMDTHLDVIEVELEYIDVYQDNTFIIHRALESLANTTNEMLQGLENVEPYDSEDNEINVGSSAEKLKILEILQPLITEEFGEIAFTQIKDLSFSTIDELKLLLSDNNKHKLYGAKKKKLSELADKINEWL